MNIGAMINPVIWMQGNVYVMKQLNSLNLIGMEFSKFFC